MPFLSQYNKDTYYQHDITVDVDLNNLAEVMFVRFLIFFFSKCVLYFSFLYISKIVVDHNTPNLIISFSKVSFSINMTVQLI